MKTEKEIRAMIRRIKKDHASVLTGTIATIDINAPRALMQVNAEAILRTVSDVIGETYTSKLKGRN